jgi:hypothetical protein
MRQVRFLRRAAARAVALLVAGIVCVGTSGLGHTAWDDPACDPIPVHHDHNAHRFHSGTLPTSPDSDHCLFCHSLRTLRTGLVATQTPVVDEAQSALVRAADAVLAGRLLDLNAPSRAPPALLL